MEASPIRRLPSVHRRHLPSTDAGAACSGRRPILGSIPLLRRWPVSASPLPLPLALPTPVVGPSPPPFPPRSGTGGCGLRPWEPPRAVVKVDFVRLYSSFLLAVGEGDGEA